MRRRVQGEWYLGYGGLDEDGRLVSVGGRPPMFHTKSNTNVLRIFGNRNEGSRFATSSNSSTTTPMYNSLYETETSEEQGGSPLSASGNLADLRSASSTFSSGSGPME